jgi:hypothetical protein
MKDDLSRAQRYRDLAAQMRATGLHEKDQRRQNEILDLAAQYQRLADILVEKHRPPPNAGRVRTASQGWHEINQEGDEPNASSYTSKTISVCEPGAANQKAKYFPYRK